MNSWKKRTKRFVLFLDILGFKDLVARNSHNYVDQKLKVLTETLQLIPQELSFLNIAKNQSRAISFSDSIIVFSKSNLKRDAEKIMMDAHHIQLIALKNNIPIKGAISYGTITVDYQNSIFFGQPIIDAYLLHEDLNLLSVVVDHHAEKKINEFRTDTRVNNNLTKYQAPMKFGRVNHMLLRLSNSSIEEGINYLQELNFTVSGKPRVYIDNTLEFYNKIKVI